MVEGLVTLGAGDGGLELGPPAPPPSHTRTGGPQTSLLTLAWITASVAGVRVKPSTPLEGG